ncbi:MAG: HAD-IIB family hydrolase [Brevinema sp.]
MKQKLLACDVDGTLIFHEDQKIKGSDLQAIKSFREAGHLFVLCTGRTAVWAIPLIQKHDLQTDGLILCNGSMIYHVNPNDPTDIKEIVNRSVPNKIGLEIINYFYHLEEFALYWDDGNQTYELHDRLVSQASSIIQENYSTHISFEEAMALTSNFVTIGVTPISCDVSKAEEIKNYILKHWEVLAFRNQFFIDIAPIGSSKGSGIEDFQTIYQKDLETYGIGDSFNDLSMFQHVGKSHAFLMSNGDVELKQYTDNQVNSVAECINLLLSKK